MDRWLIFKGSIERVLHSYTEESMSIVRKLINQLNAYGMIYECFLCHIILYRKEANKCLNP